MLRQAQHERGGATLDALPAAYALTSHFHTLPGTVAKLYFSKFTSSFPRKRESISHAIRRSGSEGKHGLAALAVQNHRQCASRLVRRWIPAFAGMTKFLL
jgi:hypothetical protein